MTQQEWRELNARFAQRQTGWPTLAVMMVDIAGLTFAVWLKGRGAVWGLLSIGVLALVLLHAYLWTHEATHAAVSRHKLVNHLVGHVAGWLIGMPYLTRRRSHMLHHVWAGHPEGDPANRRMLERFSVMTPEQAAMLERIWRSWIPLFALNDRLGLWRDAFEERRRGQPCPQIRQEIVANYLYLAGYVLVLGSLLAAGELVAAVVWYAPALVLQLLLEELVNAPHHAQSPLLRPEDKALPYWEQHRVTHSCASAPIWSSGLLLNFNLHTAHHLFPKVPWSGLPAVHRELLRRIPELAAEQTTPNELAWAMTKRRQPILKLMGHYFARGAPL